MHTKKEDKGKGFHVNSQMEKDKSNEETSDAAVCGGFTSTPNAQGEGNQSSNEGQPRVGGFFFINNEADSLSSSLSSASTYTVTEILENTTDYPPSNIAASTNTSVSSEIAQKKLNSRRMIVVFRRKASLEAKQSSVNSDCEVYQFTRSKDNAWCYKDTTVNNSSDPTIDIENQASQEESSCVLDEESVSSKESGSPPSLSPTAAGDDAGFGSYIVQNCSELRMKYLITFVLVLLLFGVSAVIAAFISASNPATDAKFSYESTTKTTTINDGATLPQTTTTSSATTASSSSESVVITYPSTSASTTSFASVADFSNIETASSLALPSPTTTYVITSSSTTSASTTESTAAPSSTYLYLQAVAASSPSFGGKKAAFVRYDISSMLNDPRGHPSKVLMHLLSGSEKGGMLVDEVLVDYLPNAGLWDCAPCEQAQIPSNNSIKVGNFESFGGPDYYLDMYPAFSRGIFNNQMTFKLYSSGTSLEPFLTPELWVFWL